MFRFLLHFSKEIQSLLKEVHGANPGLKGMMAKYSKDQAKKLKDMTFDVAALTSSAGHTLSSPLHWCRWNELNITGRELQRIALKILRPMLAALFLFRLLPRALLPGAEMGVGTEKSKKGKWVTGNGLKERSPPCGYR